MTLETGSPHVTSLLHLCLAVQFDPFSTDTFLESEGRFGKGSCWPGSLSRGLRWVHFRPELAQRTSLACSAIAGLSKLRRGGGMWVNIIRLQTLGGRWQAHVCLALECPCPPFSALRSPCCLDRSSTAGPCEIINEGRPPLFAEMPCQNMLQRQRRQRGEGGRRRGGARVQ